MADRRSRRPGRHDSGGLCRAAIVGLAAYLHGRGYAPNTIDQYVKIAERFRSWLRSKGKSHQAVCEACVWSFIRGCKTRRHLRCVHHLRSALGHLVGVLRDRGELANTPAVRHTAIDGAIEE